MNKPPLECHLDSESKVFFLHMPKAAGTSLNFLIENHFNLPEVCPHSYSDLLCEIPGGEVKGYKYFRGHIYHDLLCQLLGQQPVSLTMLRDPVERFISQFAHITRHADVWGPYQTPHIRERLTGMTLEAFIDEANHDIAVWSENVQADLLASKMEMVFSETDPFRPKALNKAATASAADLPYIKERLSGFEFVGLTERFRELIWLLGYLFGWRPMPDFQPINVSEHKPSRQSLTSSTYDKIAELNSLDLELYKHAQRLFDQRLALMFHDLLEKYGSKSDAQQALPLEPDSANRLLERHYRRRFAEANQPQRFFRMGFGDGLSGLGWFLPVKQRKFGFVRWTGSAAFSSLDVRLDCDCDYELTFKVISAANFAAVKALRLKVNDHPISIIEKYKGLETSIFVARIPETVLALDSTFARFTFETDENALTENYVPTDAVMRPTGILFNWLDAAPIIKPNASQWAASETVAQLTHLTELQARIIATLESEMRLFESEMTRQSEKVSEILIDREKSLAFLQNELRHANDQVAIMSKSKFWTLRNYFHTIKDWFQKRAEDER